MLKVVFIITALLLFSSCRWIEGMDTPYTMFANFEVPEGTPVFKQGYRDGCSTLFYARGNAFYRWKHEYRYNPKMHQNPEYRFGYKRGMSYCFNTIVPGVTSWDRHLMYYKDDSMMAKNYNDTGMFGGALGVPGETSNGLSNVLQAFWGTGENSVMGGNILWAGGSKGQFFGQSQSGDYEGITGWNSDYKGMDSGYKGLNW